MPDISQVTLPSGSQYNIKDSTARQQIENIKSATNSVMNYRGVTTTPLFDGSKVTPIKLGTEGSETDYAPVAGDVVVFKDVSYAWTGDQWDQYGSAGALKALAYKDSASGKITPSGNVSQPNFVGTKATITTSILPKGTVGVSGATAQSGQTPNYTPAGNVSQPSFTGTEGDVTVSGTAKGTVAIATGNGATNYTPAGTISVTPSVQLNTTNVNSITNVGSLPQWTASVENENLILGWNAGALPTKGAAVAVATSVKTATATGKFTGTGVDLTATFTGQASQSTGKFTPGGTVSKPNFTGTGAVLQGTFTGQTSSGSTDYTPEGTVGKPIFSGTEATVTVS